MIKVDLLGRLGNQMFQYAFAYATAKMNRTRFLITPTAPFEPARYFKLDAGTNFFYKTIPYNRYFIKLASICFPGRYNGNRVVDDQENGFVEQKDNCSYMGYFQSEKYFTAYKDQIAAAFAIKKKYTKKFQEKYSALLQHHKVIVIHVRRTDYLNFEKEHLGGKNLSLPLSYYRNCLQLIGDLSKYKILCISDDIDLVKQELGIDQQISYEQNDMITDFQLVQHADIAIIANSSFAWWAAYLNTKAEKIYAPKYWLGFRVNKEFPYGIIPGKFQPVNVY